MNLGILDWETGIYIIIIIIIIIIIVFCCRLSQAFFPWHSSWTNGDPHR
jgi:hypothetical protein